MEFPVEIPLGAWRLHPHLVFDLLAYGIGFQLFLRLRRRGDLLGVVERSWIVAAAVLGALAGSLLLGWAVDPRAAWPTGGEGVVVGKTVVGALLGGTLAVELAKRRLRITSRTGDLFAIPLCVGIAIGRIGCFLSGLPDRTHGVATSLPWGVDFGDGIARHPTQLYEIAFLVLLLALLVWRSRQPLPAGHLFRLFLFSYLGWRFVVSFLQPFPTFAGLAAIQWACLAALLLYARDVPSLVRPPREVTGDG